ncbi:ribonuclease H-like domain-containing protein [Tanacetum coccineum]
MYSGRCAGEDGLGSFDHFLHYWFNFCFCECNHWVLWFKENVYGTGCVEPQLLSFYETFLGYTPVTSILVTILNTIDYLGKFNGKADEGFFVGYSLNSKAFRVFNSRTRIVEENLHITFSESTPNVVGSRPDWIFDIDALTRTIYYEPIVAGTQFNGFAGTKASDNAGQTRKETELVKNYI